MKPLSSFIFLLAFIKSLNSEPNGNITRNSISVNMNKSYHQVNISANLFETNLNCPSEYYN